MDKEVVLTKVEVVEEDAIIPVQGEVEEEEEALVAGVAVRVEEVDAEEEDNS